MQQAFEIYYWLFVGIVGNALIAWEFGRKGFRRVGLEGPTNPRTTFAMSLWVIMLVWGTVFKLDFPDEPKHLLILIWPVSVMAFVHFSKPRSQRLYDSAKSLHETTYIVDFSEQRNAQEIAYACENPRLVRAEEGYKEALSVQERLFALARTEEDRRRAGMNIVVSHIQLALLLRHRYLPDLARNHGQTALRMIEELEDQYPGDGEVIGAKSDALFRLGEIAHLQGNHSEAKRLYQMSLRIDQSLSDSVGIAAIQKRLAQLPQGGYDA